MKASRKLLRFIGTMSDQDQESLLRAIKQTETEIDELQIIHLAMQLERIGEWILAAEKWNSIGRSRDAIACELVADKVKERREG